LAAAAVSAAVVAQVLPEAVQPAPAQARLLARLRQEGELPVPAQFPVLVPLVLARLPAVAHVVVDSVLLLDLLSRQSFSAATARSSP
jgi:hypothetical protein